MTEHNGIDILCDAAGSDLLLTSLFTAPVAAGHQQTQLQQTRQPQSFAYHDEQQQNPPKQPRKRARLSSDASPTSTPTHVCQTCKRVYERADHLTRHLRSHENARQYRCSRCPKRFNRADLLARHDSTHDREVDSRRPLIRRSDRAAEACTNCAASKAKCDDQKPCGRCKGKNLVCEMPSRRSAQYRTVSDALSDSEASPSETSTMASNIGNGAPYGTASGYPSMDLGRDEMSRGSAAAPSGMVPPQGLVNEPLRPDAIPSGIADDMIYFDPVHQFFQDMDFTSWDLNFDAFAIPQLESHGPSPQSVGTATSRHSKILRDPSKGHSAFKRSPWLWEPDSRDFGGSDAQDLHVDEESIAQSPAFDRMLTRPARKLSMSTATRDRLFTIVLAENKNPSKVPSFPSLELLNYLLQVYFVREEYQLDSYIHSASFDPDEAMSELLAGIIATGSLFISLPTVWQFGLALQEIVRQRLETIFEGSNTNTRNLKYWQTFMLQLDIGLWSGFKRKTELAESFLQPLVTMIRRSGVLSAPADSLSLVPCESDSEEVVKAKWQKFIVRESYKRLLIHLLTHDVGASLFLEKNTLVSFTELSFSLPTSNDLWRAPSAEVWRRIYLSKHSFIADASIPKVCDLMHSLPIPGAFSEYMDIDLCYSVVLHGFWGQIAGHRESIRFYQDRRQSNHRSWLKSQHDELYSDLCKFAIMVYSKPTYAKSSTTLAGLAVTAELFMMSLNVSVGDIQKFAGKAGEEEARRVSAALEDGWARTSEARYAVWHAGQVLQNSRRLPPTSLRGFNAMAAYFAALTLWVYGLLSCPSSHGGFDGDNATAAHRLQIPGVANSNHSHPGTDSPAPNQSTPVFAILDGEETRETSAFLQFDQGVPALTLYGDPKAGVEPLSNPGMVLTIAQNLFRDNFPVRSESLPPLVESLVSLLRDLGRPSRAVSED